MLPTKSGAASATVELVIVVVFAPKTVAVFKRRVDSVTLPVAVVRLSPHLKVARAAFCFKPEALVLVLTDSLTRSVEAPEPFPPLPAALEVALYRIAAEALHNSVRHSGASHCAICLVVDATSVTLTVTDDGYGLPATYLAGVGHHSMHERAAELGGSVAIFSVPTGGTRVAASFPFKEV